MTPAIAWHEWLALQEMQKMKRAALIVGVNHYKDPEIRDLECADKDCTHLHGFFKYVAKYDYVEILRQADDHKAVDAAAGMAKELEAGDLFVFYFAGHGITHEGRHLLLCHQAKLSRLSFMQQVIPVDLLKQETARPGLNRAFIIDACRSELRSTRDVGGGGLHGERALRDVVATSRPKAGSLTILCSCAEGGQAGEIAARGEGLFTAALLEELQDATDRGLEVTMSDSLESALVKRMSKLARAHDLLPGQTPWIQRSGAPPLLIGGRRSGLESLKNSEATAEDPCVQDTRFENSEITDLRERINHDVQETLRAEFRRRGSQPYLENNFRNRMTHWKKAAELDWPEGLWLMGLCYAEGIGVRTHTRAAARRYEKAAELGFAPAQYCLGRCHELGAGVTQNLNETVRWWRLAAEQGHVNSQLSLGEFFGQPGSTTRDATEAARWWRVAAKQGIASAQVELGHSLAQGDGAEQDSAEAAQWYRRAADQGDDTGQYHLGVCYLHGNGVTCDPGEAIRWLRMAAELGNADAQLELGHCLSGGTGVAQNPADAIRWYLKAWNGGNGKAGFALGMAYARGEGVVQSDSAAVKWYHRCAAGGAIADASYELGLMYSSGRGMDRPNKAESARRFKKAAQAGHADAQFRLGLAHLNGHVVPSGKTLARQWLRKAADQGHSEARSMLAKLEERVDATTTVRAVQSSSAPSNEWTKSAAPTVSFYKIWTDSDAKQLVAHVHLSMTGMKHKKACIAASFQDAAGVPLADSNGKYCSTTGTVMAWQSVIPDQDSATWKDFRFSLPLSELHLKPGSSHGCRVCIQVFHQQPDNSFRQLATSNPHSFTVKTPPKIQRPSSAAAAISLDPVVDHVGGSGLIDLTSESDDTSLGLALLDFDASGDSNDPIHALAALAKESEAGPRNYKYEGMNAKGIVVKGEVEAHSPEGALAKIQKIGVFPTRVREA